MAKGRAGRKGKAAAGAGEAEDSDAPPSASTCASSPAPPAASTSGSGSRAAGTSNRAARAAARGDKAAGRRQRAGKASAAEAEAEAAEAARRRQEQAGPCTALGLEWAREARAAPALLPAAAFDVVVVCDCLYENRESWEALQAVLTRAAAPAAAIVLASAMQRKPFLEAFVVRLLAAGFLAVMQEEGGPLGEVVVAVLHPA